MTVKRIKKASCPSRFVFFDTETIGEHEARLTGGEVHRLRLGVAVSGRLRGNKWGSRKVHRFTSETEFLRMLDEVLVPKQTTWLIAHNAGFDAQVAGLFSAMKRGEFRIVEHSSGNQQQPEGDIWAEPNPKALIIADPPTVVQLEDKRGRRVVLLDSMNWAKQPLATLGEAVKLPKLAMPKWGDPDSDWFYYCQRDVEILERWFLAYVGFVREYELGPVKWTISSQAMAAYRFGHCRQTIHSHRIEPVRKLEREGYYGGQFRVFRLGHFSGHYIQCDCNSLFPSVMIGKQYPVKLTRWGADEPWRTCEPKFDPSASVAEVFLWTDPDDYPRRQDGIPDPTTGRFRTVLCGEELARAFRLGHVLGWRKWAEYELAPIFDTYVETMYSLRLEAREQGRKDVEGMAKMLLNSLYGKFGQRGSDYVFRPEICPPIEWGRWVLAKFDLSERREFSVCGGEAYELVDRKELGGSVPIVSAFVTAAARERMLQLRSLVPPESLYYQSVDSLIVDSVGYSHLEAAGELDPLALGKMKVTGETETLEINGHGWYKVGEKTVLPGRKPRVLEETAQGFAQLQFEGVKSHLFREPESSIFVRKRFVNFPSHFKRGTVNDKGFVEPPRVWEDEPF